MPVVKLVTRPELFIVATKVLVLLHVPPPTASDNKDVLPRHTVSIPVIGARRFTVTMAVE